MPCRNTYSALNALAGHFNSFGPTAPVPKKRMERIQKVRMFLFVQPACWVYSCLVSLTI